MPEPAWQTQVRLSVTALGVSAMKEIMAQRCFGLYSSVELQEYCVAQRCFGLYSSVELQEYCVAQRCFGLYSSDELQEYCVVLYYVKHCNF